MKKAFSTLSIAVALFSSAAFAADSYTLDSDLSSKFRNHQKAIYC